MTQPSESARSSWWVYQGSGAPHNGIDSLPAAPPWRRFGGATPRHIGEHRRGAFKPDPETLDLVNAAIFLRRPLLVSGQPGTGKSTLAYSIAHELKLGPVLHWPITSRSTVSEGLYDYDAIGRLQESQHRRADGVASDIGSFVKLGPLGTALLGSTKPRVLLIDEFDKSDVDLPNDLLNVFEEGTFGIRELERVPDDGTGVEVYTTDPGERHRIVRGRVTCDAFPIVILTSNNEREFPPAFQRRCLRLRLAAPDREQLSAIVAAHLGDVDEPARAKIDRFLELQRDGRDRAIDQLLNQVYLGSLGPGGSHNPARETLDRLVTPLGEEPG